MYDKRSLYLIYNIAAVSYNKLTAERKKDAIETLTSGSTKYIDFET